MPKADAGTQLAMSPFKPDESQVDLTSTVPNQPFVGLQTHSPSGHGRDEEKQENTVIQYS